MKLSLCMMAVGALALIGNADQASAKGCIKGAVVGGVAGHYAGHHAVLGAVGGCIVGRHLANEKAKEDAGAAAQHEQAPAGPPAAEKGY